MVCPLREESVSGRSHREESVKSVLHHCVGFMANPNVHVCMCGLRSKVSCVIDGASIGKL